MQKGIIGERETEREFLQMSHRVKNVVKLLEIYQCIKNKSAKKDLLI